MITQAVHRKPEMAKLTTLIVMMVKTPHSCIGMPGPQSRNHGVVVDHRSELCVDGNRYKGRGHVFVRDYHCLRRHSSRLKLLNKSSDGEHRRPLAEMGDGNERMQMAFLWYLYRVRPNQWAEDVAGS